jgi:aspartate/methionine/tyrosine aminotransferase
MNDILLAKPNLPHGYLDLSAGEPHIIRECLEKTFSLHPYTIPNETGIWEYPFPNGNPDLVRILEDKHKAPVVICNGAKQGLSGVFYVLKEMGRLSIGLQNPHWALLPPLIKMNRLLQAEDLLGGDVSLLVSPNNPDGATLTEEEVKKLSDNCKERGRILIHDAAYHSHSYLSETHLLKPIGDVQVFSASKLLGLSGLRIGYVVCHNKNFYQPLCEYMETMTVGVSNISQLFLRDLLTRMYAYPTLTEKFQGLSFMALEKAKTIIKDVDPEVLEVPKDFEKTNGMFGFFKKGTKADFEKAKLHVADGKHFGMEGYVRLNLAFGEDKMKEIVKRLNEGKQ